MHSLCGDLSSQHLLAGWCSGAAPSHQIAIQGVCMNNLDGNCAQPALQCLAICIEEDLQAMDASHLVDSYHV